MLHNPTSYVSIALGLIFTRFKFQILEKKTMIQIENLDVFGKVIADSLKRVDDNAQIPTWEKTRCVNAIAKAAARLQDSTYSNFIEFDGDAGEMVIWNTVTNCVYTVGEECQCMAAQAGFICWHHAAKRLYELYLPLALKEAFEKTGEIEHTEVQIMEAHSDGRRI
jgi:hypothetical protein